VQAELDVLEHELGELPVEMRADAVLDLRRVDCDGGRATSLAARRFQVKEEDEKNDEPGYLCAFRTRASFDRTPLKISYAAA
jgi:hypothetical protein